MQNGRRRGHEFQRSTHPSKEARNKALVVKRSTRCSTIATTRLRSAYGRRTTFNTALISHLVVRVCSISSRASFVMGLPSLISADQARFKARTIQYQYVQSRTSSLKNIAELGRVRDAQHTPGLHRSLLPLGHRCLESIARCSKTCRRPAERLRDTDDVQDQKQWHGERRNVAHGKHGHGCSGDSVRIDDPGERAQG